MNLQQSKTCFLTPIIIFCLCVTFSSCQEEMSCFDGKQNQGERGIDCGDDAGLCPSCAEVYNLPNPNDPNNDPNDPNNDPNDPNNDPNDPNNDPNDPSVIEDMTYYQIDIQGETYTSFTRSACLYISPRIVAAGEINLDNGDNAVDIGLVSGFPAGFPEPGAIWFFSNTAMCQYGSTGCNSIPINSALDVCFITASESNGIINIDIELDGELFNNAAAGSILTANGLNNFTAGGSTIATLWQLVTGEMHIQISENGQTLSGDFSFIGNDFFGTGTTSYTGSFSGQQMDIAVNECM